jgi:hypothetical protein
VIEQESAMRQEWIGKRQAVRTHVQLRAQIRLGASRPPLDCTISDISLTGARILVPVEGTLPDDFDLYIAARSETKWARVRWRDKQQIGVEFLTVKHDDGESVPPTILDRLTRLEDRLAELSDQPGEDVLFASPPASDRLAEIERRLAEVGGQDQPAELARIAALEDRLAALESAEAPQSSEPAQAKLELVISRLGQVEARLAECDEAAQRRAGGVETRVGELEARVAASAGADEGEDLQAKWDARLRALETSTGELRACLRTLVLLTAAQIKRSNA